MLHSHVGMAWEPIGLGVGRRGSIGVSVSFPLRMTRDSVGVCATPASVLASLGFFPTSSIARHFCAPTSRSEMFAACLAHLINLFMQLYVFRTLQAFASIPRRVFRLTLHSLWPARHSHLEARAFESGSWWAFAATAETVGSCVASDVSRARSMQPIFASVPVINFQVSEQY